MKKETVLYIVFFCFIVLFSCSELNEENIQRFSDIPSLIQYSEGDYTYFINRVNEFQGNRIEGVEAGNWVYMSYNLDFNNQPVVVPPYSVTDVTENRTNLIPGIFSSDKRLMNTNDIDTLYAVNYEFFLENYMLFTIQNRIISEYMNPTYQIIWDLDSVEVKGEVNFWFANKLNIGQVDPDSNLYAFSILVPFDISSLFENPAIRNILEVNTEKSDTVFLNMKYPSNTNAEGFPDYTKSITRAPSRIFYLADSLYIE